MEGVENVRIVLPDTEEMDIKPTWIDIWKNGKYGYCAQLKTDEGNVVGDAEYSGTKAGAESTEKMWEIEFSIDHEYSLKKRKEYRQKLKERQ